MDTPTQPSEGEPTYTIGHCPVTIELHGEPRTCEGTWVIEDSSPLSRHLYHSFSTAAKYEGRDITVSVVFDEISLRGR